MCKDNGSDGNPRFLYFRALDRTYMQSTLDLQILYNESKNSIFNIQGSKLKATKHFTSYLDIPKSIPCGEEV